ncbi:hypothetical protein GIS00_12325 [Nakamurella sp. YIM 132087]|uniref:DUF3558 domain-containing protein n=1 Tax=Nakamurella alba TaxID=2665158 RepID=A0A7K1FKQ1_9ACTN|nr:hypothetical protein [Nakamurella alba]MTD14727.1 hypothetical protein [Nakamurella alba]
MDAPLTLCRRLIAPCAAVLLFLIAGCSSTGGTPVAGSSTPPSTTPSGPPDADAVWLTMGVLPPYNPQNQQQGWKVEVLGNGTIDGNGPVSGRSLTPDALDALLAGVRDLCGLTQQDMGGRIYDGGEFRLRVDLPGCSVQLTVEPGEYSGMHTAEQKVDRERVRAVVEQIRKAVT